MISNLISCTLIYLASGSVVWMLASDALAAHVRLKAMVRGRRPRARRHVMAAIVMIVGWPVPAAKWAVTGRAIG